MTNITPLYWEVNGESLHTHAWAIETLGGTRAGSAPLRGSDFQVPFTTGSKWTKKFADSRTIDLPMWTQPVNPDGTADNSMSSKAKMQSNWKRLMRQFKNNGNPVELTSRFYNEAGQLVVARAQAELLDRPAPTVVAQDTFRFSVPLQLADPWFYGDPITVGVGDFTVLGDNPTDHVVLSMGSGRVTNGDGNWIEYDGGGTVVIDMHDGTAQQGGQYVNGLISRNPRFFEFIHLQPGPNNMSGSGSITYEPAYD